MTDDHRRTLNRAELSYEMCKKIIYYLKLKNNKHKFHPETVNVTLKEEEVAFNLTKVILIIRVTS